MADRTLLRDTKDQYGFVSVALHWFIAAVIITLLTTGAIIFPMPRGAERTALMNFHLSVASVAAPIILFRIAWRLRYGKPKLPPQPPVFEFTASVVWRFLLFAVILQLITGPTLTWAHKHGIGIATIWEIPSPFPDMSRQAAARLHDTATAIHAAVGFSIAAVLGLHILGALKHLLIDRDGITQRMLRPGARTAGHAPLPEPVADGRPTYREAT